MKKIYDLIVVGAGPAGLMAAKTAGENGLDVALLERKNSITDISRACSMMLVTLTGKYLEDRVQLNTREKRLCFPKYGFSIPYDGAHQDFYSWSIYSYKGNKIQLGDYQKNAALGEQGRISAVYDKEALLACLLREACKNHVDVFSGYNVINTRTENGKVTVFTSEGCTFTGTFVIGADGRSSRLAKNMGLNRTRKYYGTNISFGYEMTGVETPEKYELFQLFVNNDPPLRVWMTPRAKGDKHFAFVCGPHPEVDLQAAFDGFISKGYFAPWFHNAEKTRALSAIGNMYSHIEDPYKDQVFLISDAVWCQEAEMTGAVISGWKAANAVTFALAEGKISREGVSGYLTWWRDEVINRLDHEDMMRNIVMPYRLTPDDIDFLLGSIKRTLKGILDPYETPQLVGGAMAEIMPMVKSDRPDIFNKMIAMRAEPLDLVFRNCARSGFPTTMRTV
jgi:flavin-dependent dehydrogenase